MTINQSRERGEGGKKENKKKVEGQKNGGSTILWCSRGKR